MNADAWARLSEWHNVWLSAAPAERDRLRRDFVSSNPLLERDVMALVAAGPIAPGFLETPALALTLEDLAHEDQPLAAGTRLGPYELVELLARGGMGQVYRATDVRLGRDVAVKVLPGGSEHEPESVQRFIQEARVTASLDRPNIVRVFDVGMHEGRPFLVMELLQGETLRQRLSRGPLPAVLALGVALDVSRGLVAAHAAGLIHHDLKPENLFLTHDGPVKILDFGVAKLAPATRSSATATPTHLTATAGLLIWPRKRSWASRWTDARTSSPSARCCMSC
jgi:serine/threonine protein kinase